MKLDSLLAESERYQLYKVKEADEGNLVPTTSTSITLLLGDCLATTVMSKKKIYKRLIFHPGGNIGGSLLLAKDIMVTGNKHDHKL